jgi:predicted phage terminase large subunit-like protein
MVAVPLEVYVAEKVLAERSLYEFVQQAWPHAPTACKFVDNWHVKLICDHLQAVFEEKIENLLINIPPGIGKSIISNVFFPAWCWANRPELRMLFTTYGQDLSLRDSDYCRQLLKSKWYQKRWGRKFQIRDGSDAKKRFENDKGGYRMSTSVDGVGTGEHPHIIVGDDLHKADHASSPKELQNAIDFWSVTLGTRGIMTGCRRILIGQRICPGDVSRHAKTQNNYVQLILPMRFKPGMMKPTVAGMDPRTTIGELLFPQAVPEEKVQALELTLGWKASAQLGQDPAPPEGAIFDEKKFRRVRLVGDTEWGRGLPRGYFELLDMTGNVVARVSPADCYWFQTLDYAAKVKSINDYTVCGTFALTPANDVIVFHIHREKIKIPKQFAMAMALRQRFPFVSVQAVEDASGGTTVIQTGEEEGIDFEVLRAITDKVDRAGPISRYYDNGKVYHLEGETWIADFESELLQFPLTAHDDQVDVAAWAGQHILERSLKRVGIMTADGPLPDVRGQIEAMVAAANGESGRAASNWDVLLKGLGRNP